MKKYPKFNKTSQDLTVAGILKRVSGITIEQDNAGNGQYTVLRRMDKRYNYTLVNGIKTPSTDRENHYIPLDIFPSELLQRLEVIKTLTLSMESDAFVFSSTANPFFSNANFIYDNANLNCGTALS